MLGQETERAMLRGRYGVGNRAVRSDNHDAQPGRLRPQLVEQPDAIHLVHTEVGDDEIGTEAMQDAERLVRRLHGLDFVTLYAQADAQEPQEPRFIVYRQYFALPDWLFRNRRGIILHLRVNV
jgi:hypothetical protein